MARSNNLYKRGANYWYRFMHDGQQFRGSCHTSDPALAKLIYEEEYKQVLLGFYSIKKIPTFKEMSDIWLSHFANVHSQDHLTTGKYFFNSYLNPAIGNKRLDCIDAEMWNDAFKDFLLDKSRATYNNMVKYFNLVCNYALTCKYKYDRWKAKDISEQERARPVIRANTLADFLRGVRQHHRNPQVHVALEFMLFTGLRESEVIHATWANLRIEDRTYTVAPTATKRTTKTAKIRSVEISDDLLQVLLAYQKTQKTLASDLIFGNLDGSHKCKDWLTNALDEICKRMGIPKLGSHRLRASFITIQDGLGTPMKSIQRLVGHTKLATTARYLEDDQEQRVTAQEKMAGLKIS